MVAGSNPAGPVHLSTNCGPLVSGVNTRINTSGTELLSQFKEFCRIDRNLSERTVSLNSGYPFQVRRFLESINKHPTQVTADDVRSFLSKFQDRSASTRANILKALKIFFRDFLKMPEVVETFKFPKRTYTPKTVPSIADLKRFFDALENDCDRATFLMYATSGLRRNELLSLTVNEVDIENRTIIPRNAHKNGTTKNTWCSCFNVEAQTYLRQYLENRQTDDKRLFQISEVTHDAPTEKQTRRQVYILHPKSYATGSVVNSKSLAFQTRMLTHSVDECQNRF